MDNLDLSEFFKTKAQANDFSVRLATITEQMFQNDFSLEKTFLEQFGVQKKDTFIMLLRDNNVALESHASLKDFFGKIQAKILTIPILSLAIAFEPKEQTLKALSEWFVLNLNKQILLDIKVDPNLVAGAALTINGKFLNFSVKPKFDQILHDMMAQKAAAAATPQTEKQNIPHNHQKLEDFSLGR